MLPGERDLEFKFDERLHDPDPKYVLGKKIHAGGMKDGEQVIELLVHHPSTAKFISTKLARRFVSDSPPPSLVNRMAETFKSSEVCGCIRGLGTRGSRAYAAGLGEMAKALEQAHRAVKDYDTDAVNKPAAEIALAQIQARFGDHDAAIAALPHLLAVPAGLTIANLKLDPFWDPLRKDPRFQKLSEQPVK